MKYRLVNLKIENFVGIKKAEIGFTTPVTLFAGVNRAGKSTIKDALNFAFTGMSRNVRKFKDVKQLAHDDKTKELKVTLNYNDEHDSPCVIERTVKEASKGVDSHNPLIRYCLDPLAFIRLKAGERGAILSSVLSEGLDELVEKAIAESIGNVPTEILQQIKGSGIDIHDVDAFRAEAVNIRRHYKRKESELILDEPDIVNFGYDPKDKVEDVEKQLKEIEDRIRKGYDVIAAKKALLQNEAAVVDLKKKIRETIAKIVELTETESAMIEDYETNLRTINLFDTAIKRQLCPVCQQRLNVELVRECEQNIREWLTEHSQEVKELKAKRDFNKHYQTRLEIDKESLKALEKIVRATKTKDLPADVEEMLDNLRASEADLKQTLENYRRFKAAQEAHEQNVLYEKELKMLIEECDRIDEALKDGGDVKTMIAAGGKELPVNNRLLAVWNLNMKILNNGEIELDDRPIELASESEKYMCASALSLALAEIGEVGFCALDGYEVLVGDNANVFFDAVDESKLNNVLVFASSTKKFKSSDDLSVFSVEKGVVCEVK